MEMTSCGIHTVDEAQVSIRHETYCDPNIEWDEEGNPHPVVTCNPENGEM